MAAAHVPQYAPISDNRAVDCRKPVARARFLANSRRPIDLVCERIYRDWLRGVTERSLSASYARFRGEIEEIVREQAQLQDRILRGRTA